MRAHGGLAHAVAAGIANPVIGAAALVLGCGSRSDLDLESPRADASVAPKIIASDRPRDAPAFGSGGAGGRSGSGGAFGLRDASAPARQRRRDGASSDSPVVDARDTVDVSMQDARIAQVADASGDDAADALTSPDCSCPPSDYFIDATMGAAHMHLTAPYKLLIYCEETTVHLAHPPCDDDVYRLSACYGPSSEPPCVYLAVTLSRGLLLGGLVDASGQDWIMEAGEIAPDAPVRRIATGTFSATLRPRGGGDAAVLSGSFRACVPRMPACAR